MSSEKINHRVFKPQDESLISHYVFNVTLQLRTPLNILKKHGKKFYGPYEDIPRICDPKHGIWVFQTKSFKELGIDVEESFSPEKHASDIGYTTVEDYLPFLINFRKIYESDASKFQKYQEIKKLCRQSKKNEEICKKLNDYYEIFPESYIWGTLYKIPGIGFKTVKQLNEIGINKLSELKYVKQDVLLKIQGLGKGTLKNIDNFFKDNMQEF